MLQTVLLCVAIGLLAVIAVRQEMIHMATGATLTDVTDGLTTLESDVQTLQTTTTTLANDSATILTELKALQAASSTPVDFDPIVARQTALHTALTALNTSLVAIDAGDVASEPAPSTPAPTSDPTS